MSGAAAARQPGTNLVRLCRLYARSPLTGEQVVVASYVASLCGARELYFPGEVDRLQRLYSLLLPENQRPSPDDFAAGLAQARIQGAPWRG